MDPNSSLLAQFDPIHASNLEPDTTINDAPNSSLLLQFDPILATNTSKATPARSREPASNNAEALTMSAFFNRINSQPNTQFNKDTLPLPKFNRGSLIDLGFNLQDDLKSVSLEDLSLSRSQSTTLIPDPSEAENIPLPPSPPRATRTSPRKERPIHPPPSPSKHKAYAEPSEIPENRERRSSLDISSLTLDIKHRLAVADMSFDILKDDISFLTNMVEEDPSTLLRHVTRSERKGALPLYVHTFRFRREL